jgi:hypothetical protein
LRGDQEMRVTRAGSSGRAGRPDRGETGDGYAARDVLAHDGRISLLKEQQAQRLAQTVDACALARRAISPVLRADLAFAMDISEAVIVRALSGNSATTGPAR